jgi:hypothetical protein
MLRVLLSRKQTPQNRSVLPATARRRHARPRLELLEDRNLLTTFFVWQFGGSDQFGNGSINAPFQTIQQAVNLAASGDTIKVAGGVYTYNPATDQVIANFGATGVVQVVNKFLNIFGGFNPANGYTVSTPAATPSVIDGQGQFRGVFLTANAFGGAALDMDGFTIQNCIGTSIPARGGASAINGYGGGMLSELSSTYLSNMIFQNDRAFGVNSATGAGGAGAGGGLGAFSDAGTVTLNNVTFTNCSATGANGATVGGFGQGGGFFADHCNVSGANLTVTNCSARGGDSSGPGTAGGETGDALGGGLDFESCFTGVTLSRVTATNNTATGGNAPGGLGGGGFGGGLLAEITNITIFDSNFRNDLALGGNGINNSAARGSLASGGGINLTNSNLTIDRTFLIANTAQGGNGGPVKGGPTGGGISLFVSGGNPPNSIVMTNCVVADNVAAYGAGSAEMGGGGGGLSMFGGNATLTQCTFANNSFAGSSLGTLQGLAVLAHNPTGVAANVVARYSIFANHTSTFAAAIHAFPGNSVAFNTNLFAANSQDTNPGGSFSGQASNISAASAGFVSPFAPNYNYQITAASPAVHKAVGSTTPVDITNSPRPNPPSIGAFEAAVPTLQFASSSFTYRQDAGTVFITVTRTGDLSSSLTVTYTVSNGTAVAGTNYRATSPGSVVFNPGDASKTFPITLLSTAPNRGTLTINLALTSISLPGAQFGAPQTATVFVTSSKAQTIGIFDPSSATWYLRLQNSAGAPNIGPFGFGGAGWRPLSGDWNGDGVASIGVVDPNNTFYLRNENSPGSADAGTFQYGAPGWTPFSGNWLGNGRSGIGVFDGSTGTWYVRSTATPGAPDLGVFPFGAPGWIPVVGDWTGTGHDGIGVVDPTTNTWYLRSTVSPGAPDVGVFRYGLAGWLPVTGDWTGLGHTGIGVVDPGSETWYLRNTATPGGPDFSPFPYGGAGWLPVAGSWIGVGGAPQLADPFESFSNDTSAGLTQAQLNSVVTAALTRLQLAGIDPATIALLASADYVVGDLPGTIIGFTSGNIVTIDRHAAGRGWFVDPTPLDDAEFDAGGTALAGTAAVGKMDLLTVVLHEMGHVAGRGDQFTPGDLMYDILSTGQRRTGALDALFAGMA